MWHSINFLHSTNAMKHTHSSIKHPQPGSAKTLHHAFFSTGDNTANRFQTPHREPTAPYTTKVRYSPLFLTRYTGGTLRRTLCRISPSLVVLPLHTRKRGVSDVVYAGVSLSRGYIAESQYSSCWVILSKCSNNIFSTFKAKVGTGDMRSTFRTHVQQYMSTK